MDFGQQLDAEPTEWQELVLSRFARDLESGVAWHAHAKEPPAAQLSKKSLLREVRLDAASRLLASNGKYIPMASVTTLLDLNGAIRYLKQALGETWSNYIDADSPHTNDKHNAVHISEKAIDDVISSVIYARSFDPREQIGDWSGRSYSAPSNNSPRLYRKGLWDINIWEEPKYRRSSQSSEQGLGAFQSFLDFCLPAGLEQGVLLDWLAWSLQNESRRPNWAIFLYSEEKGTGKSTILSVARALFGEQNTASENGLDKLLGRFAIDSLNKKLITVEEVQITSFSKAGNSLKELITGDKTSIDVKYQAAQTVPLSACIMLTSNHRPTWLEGGERRYYIINLSHDGHAQGPRSIEFKVLASQVNEQISNEAGLKGLYEALMSRKLHPEFNPYGLKFETFASPIMRELLDEAVVETDEVLLDLLQQYRVVLIPSSEQKHLERYLGLKSQQLRNLLSRLGWKTDKISIDGKQQRFWIKGGIERENGMLLCTELSENLRNAVEMGFVWWPVKSAITGWTTLLEIHISPKKEEYSALYARSDSSIFEFSGGQTGEHGPYIDSARTAGYWASDEALEWIETQRGTFQRL